MVEARHGAGFVGRRALGRAQVAIDSIHSAARRRGGPDSGCPSVVGKPGGRNNSCTWYASDAAKYVHSRHVVRDGCQRTASNLSKLVGEFARRQTHIDAKRDDKVGDPRVPANVAPNIASIFNDNSTSCRSHRAPGRRPIRSEGLQTSGRIGIRRTRCDRQCRRSRSLRHELGQPVLDINGGEHTAVSGTGTR